MNEILKKKMLAEGQEWTRDILPMCWRPDPRLARHENWLRIQPERQHVKKRFGLDLGPKELVGV